MNSLYRFDDILIDLPGFRLLKDGHALPVEPKALNLLIFLVQNRRRLVERRELIDAVWGEAFVTDHVLNRSIGHLRKLLGDDAKEPRYIETVPTLGYRFVANVIETPDALTLGPEVQQPESATRPTQFQRAGWRLPLLLGGAGVALASLLIFWTAGRGSASRAIRSLVVLPLENVVGDSSQEYLADGMTDELITRLGQIGALRVISQTTAMQYKNAHKSLPQIARELNVDAVVEGSVVRSGDRIRIAAQLIDAADDKQLWAQNYEGDLRDVLGLQNQVASRVAEEIRIKLTEKEQAHLAEAHPVNTPAYEAFLKGKFFEQNTPETERKALQYFQQAVELDPNFARAYVGIARCYNYLASWEAVPPGEAAASSDAAVAKALELDPNLGEAYGERAWTLLFFHWDFPGAERDFRRSLELDPGSADDHDGLGAYFIALRRFDDGLRE